MASTWTSLSRCWPWAVDQLISESSVVRCWPIVHTWWLVQTSPSLSSCAMADGRWWEMLGESGDVYRFVAWYSWAGKFVVLKNWGLRRSWNQAKHWQVLSRLHITSFIVNLSVTLTFIPLLWGFTWWTTWVRSLFDPLSKGSQCTGRCHLLSRWCS